MLFFIGWKERPGGGVAEQEQGLEVFNRWQPPVGVEFKGMWARADGAGFGIAEVQSAEALLEAMGPWAGTILDFETCPIVEMDKAMPLFQKSMQFRRGG
jgi:hypothetical protein